MHEWGYEVRRLYGDPEMFESVGQFRAAIRLVQADGSSRPMDLVDATVRNVLSGDSNYVVAPGDARFGIEVEGSRIDWLAHLNEYGRVASFEVSPFGAATLRDAADMVHLMLERLVIRYAVPTGIALRWDALVVEEVSGAPRLISHRVGYPVVGLREPFAFGESLGIVDSFGRLIVEAEPGSTGSSSRAATMRPASPRAATSPAALSARTCAPGQTPSTAWAK